MALTKEPCGKLAMELGACRVLGKTMTLLPDDVNTLIGGDQMPVKLIKRNGNWHIDDTLGPPGRRVHVRQSTKTNDKKKAQRIATEIERAFWVGHTDGPAAILTFAEAVRLYRAAGKGDDFLPPVEDYLGSPRSSRTSSQAR
jgi:hypothetical protein